MSAREEALGVLGTLAPVDLAGLEARAALLHRSDRKYVVGWADVAALVTRLSGDHLALEIGGRRDFGYDTVYFDSAGFDTFHQHVRGHRRRFKVRVRHYADAGVCALEVKLRGRRGETLKHRLAYHVEHHGTLTADASAFLADRLREAYGTAPPAGLRPVVRTHYRRATLVAAPGGERLTCDFDLRFEPGPAAALIPDRVIVETKSADGRGAADRVLRELGHRPQPCSKYLMGVGLLGLRPVPNDLRRLAARSFAVPEPARG